MREPMIHVSFDFIGAAIILLVLLLVATGLVLLTSWYWKRRQRPERAEGLARSSAFARDAVMVEQWEVLLDNLPMGLLLTEHFRHSQL